MKLPEKNVRRKRKKSFKRMEETYKSINTKEKKIYKNRKYK
jgi:hypothetical protein